jgi:hypothetical protein
VPHPPAEGAIVFTDIVRIGFGHSVTLTEIWKISYRIF